MLSIPPFTGFNLAFCKIFDANLDLNEVKKMDPVLYNNNTIIPLNFLTFLSKI